MIFFFNAAATTEIYTLSLHDALPTYVELAVGDIDHPQDAGHEGQTQGGDGKHEGGDRALEQRQKEMRAEVHEIP